MTFPINEYRVLVTGSRDWEDPVIVHNALWEVWTQEVLRCYGWNLIVVHGACPSGADKAADDWAKRMQRVYQSVHPDPHPAKWKEHGKKAGFIRNAEMVDRGADQCLAFYQPGAKNNGTHDTAMRAKAWGIPLKLYGQPSEQQNVDLAIASRK